MESSAPGQGGPERAKVLIDELSDAIDVQYGGGAKLIVLGGVGTEEGKENVHKLWPKVHGEEANRAASEGRDPAQPPSAECFVAHAPNFLLSDLSVLDLSSLQWSFPATEGSLEPPRAGHSATTIPLRVFSDADIDPPVLSPASSVGQGHAFLPSLLSAPVTPDVVDTGMSGAGTAGHLVLRSLLQHVQRMRRTEHTPRAPRLPLVDASPTAGARSLPPASRAQLAALSRCIGRVCWTLGAPKPWVPLSLAEDAVNAVLLTRNPAALAGREDRIGVAMAVIHGMHESSHDLAHVADPLGPSPMATMALTGTGTRRHHRPKFVKVAELQRALMSSKALPVAARCIEEASHWNHPGAHHVVVQMGQLRLAPGAKLPAGCDKLQIVVEIHALSAALEDPALGRRASRVFSPSELSETAVDFSWPIHGHDDSPALVEALAAMQRGEADYNVTVRLIGRVSGVSAPGESGDAEFEVAVGVVDLSGTTAGMDVECDDLELHGVTGATKDAKIGLPLLAGAVSCFFTRAMEHAARLHSKTFVDAFKIVVFGGLSKDPVSGALASVGQLGIYDAVSNAWSFANVGTPQAPEPGPRAMHAAAALQGTVFITGGEAPGGEAMADIQALDSRAMQWYDATPTSGLIARSGHVAAMVPGAVLVGERAILLLHGGRSGPTGAVFGDVQAVDVTRHLQRAMLSTIGASPASFGIDDRVLRDPEWPCPCVVDVDAGASEGPSSRFNHAAALVMPRAGTSLEDLQALVALPAGDRIQRWGPHGGLGARMYVFGGRDAAGTLLGDLWRLSVEEIAGDVGGAVRVSWEVVEAAGPAPPPAESAAMTAVGRKVFLLNGWSGAETCPWSRDCHVLDTASREWAALRFTDSPPDGRFLHSVSLADYRAASSAFSTVHGPALVTEASGYSISTQAGSQIELIVQARDALGAPAERSGAIFSVYLHAEGAGAGDAPSGVAEGDVRDLGLGLYKVALPVVAAGRFLLDIVGEDGASVQGCPLPVAVASGPPVPANAVLEGPGLEAGEVGKPREVFLTLHDALGNAVPMDDDALSRLAVRITGPAEDKRTLETELRGGRACIRYSTTQVGVCRLSIRYASREVPGSPVSVEMLPGPASRAQTRVSGRCIGGRWVANIPVAVTVQACDAFGNKLTVGGDAVAVAAEMISRDPKADPAAGSPRAGPRVVGEVTDYNDGTYGAMLALSDVGLYAVTVQISGADPGVVEGSPFFVRIMAGEIDVSFTDISGPGVGSRARDALVAGERVEYVLVAHDGSGRRIEGGNDVFKAWLTRPQQESDKPARIINAEVHDRGDGTYVVSLVPQEFGTYDFHIEGRSGFSASTAMQAVPGSPFRVHVMAGSVCPGKCMAVGEGIGRSGTVSSGQLMQFTVQLCDAFGNPVRRPAAKEVQCAIETGSWSIPSEVKDNGDGTYTVSYLPDLALAPTAKDEAVQQVLKAAATVLRLDVTVDGEPIQWSPFYQGVSPIGVDPTLCTLLDVPQQINAGETHKIVLQSVNKDGVELDSGGAVFHVSLTGHPEAIADIRDDNNGQYSIRVLAKAVGHYDLELSIKSGGAHVMRSPIRLSVVPPGLFKSGFWTGARTMDEAAANNFVMSGTGLTHAVAGVEAGFEIASRRADEQTPASSFLVEFRPAGHDGDVVYGEVTGPVKGVYSCRYRLYTSGQYSLIVKLAKFTLKGCPKVVDVEPNVTSAERCKVYGEGLSREVTRDAEHTFFVETLDAHGNPTWHRQDRIDVEIRGGKLDVFKRKGVMRARFRKAVVKADVERVEDNVYKCSYRVPQHGWYGIILKHQRSGEGDWAPMGDSPYEVEVVRPAVAQSTWSATTAADKGAVIQGLSSYHNAVAEIALRQARKIDAPSGPSDPFENRKRKGGGGAVDLQGKTKPKRFLARLRGELRDSASSRDRSSMVQSAAGGNRPAKGGEITAVASKAAAAVGKASVNPLQLKGALQKARAEQTDAGDDVPATRPKTGKRRVGFGSVGGSNRAMFMLEEDTASGGLFGIGTWGQSAKVEQKPVPVGLAQVQLPVAQGSSGSLRVGGTGTGMMARMLSLESRGSRTGTGTVGPNTEPGKMGFSRVRLLRALRGDT